MKMGTLFRLQGLVREAPIYLSTPHSPKITLKVPYKGP